MAGDKVRETACAVDEAVARRKKDPGKPVRAPEASCPGAKKAWLERIGGAANRATRTLNLEGIRRVKDKGYEYHDA